MCKSVAQRSAGGEATEKGVGCVGDGQEAAQVVGEEIGGDVGSRGDVRNLGAYGLTWTGRRGIGEATAGEVRAEAIIDSVVIGARGSP